MLQPPRQPFHLLGLPLAFLLSSCSSPEAPLPNDSTSWCSSLSLSLQSGAPGERVGLKGLPENQPVLYARVTVPGVTEPSLVLIEKRLDDPMSKPTLIVPVHPATPFIGGAAELELTDGTVNCAPRPFTIGALPDPNAPEVRGTLARQAAELQTAISAQAQALGLDPALLRGNLSNLPPEAAALGLAQFFVDHPENTNALAVVARRGSVLSNGKLVPFDTALMDALLDGCTGPAALASAQQLNGCMASGAGLQDLYEALELHAELINLTLGPLAIAFPALGTPLMAIGYTYYFMNAAVLLEASGSPRALASLEFSATPRTFTRAQQSGRWRDVQVTVADGEPINLSEIVTGLIENAGLGTFLPSLGAEGEPLRRLLDYQFELVAGLVLQELTEAYGYKLDLPGVPYSAYGPVDITPFRESYTPSLVGGDELQLLSAATRPRALFRRDASISYSPYVRGISTPLQFRESSRLLSGHPPKPMNRLPSPLSRLRLFPGTAKAMRESSGRAKG